MDFKERLAQTQAKLDEFKDKLNAFASDPDAVDKAFGRLDEKLSTMIVEGMDKAGDAVSGLDGKVDQAIREGAENYDAAAGKVQATVDSALETAEGNCNAAAENIRMAVDEGDAQVNSDLIQIQMRLEAAKAKIDEKRDAADKAIQEELINELLDYADDCQALAMAYTNEAMAAVKQASDLIDAYDAKYGKTE